MCSRDQPFFQRSHNNSPNVSFTESNYKSKECWFDNICTQKRNTYLEAFCTFNCLKNDENRRVLLEKKRDYKLFKWKKKTTSGTVTLQEFEEHFKEIGSDVTETLHGDVEDFFNNFDTYQPDTPTFPE